MLTHARIIILLSNNPLHYLSLSPCQFRTSFSTCVLYRPIYINTICYLFYARHNVCTLARIIHNSQDHPPPLRPYPFSPSLPPHFYLLQSSLQSLILFLLYSRHSLPIYFISPSTTFYKYTMYIRKEKVNGLWLSVEKCKRLSLGFKPHSFYIWPLLLITFPTLCTCRPKQCRYHGLSLFIKRLLSASLISSLRYRVSIHPIGNAMLFAQKNAGQLFL